MLLLYYILFFCFAIERFINTFLMKKKNSADILYKGLTHALIFTYTFNMFLPFFDFLFKKNGVDLIFMIIGIAFLIFGLILRKRSISELGEDWSVYTVNKNKRLVKTGPYKYFCHPYYFSVICELIGYAMYFNSFLGFCSIFILQIPLLIYRVQLEEKILFAQFEIEYWEYKKGKIF